MTRLKNDIPGIILVFLISLVAAWLGTYFPIIGGPVFGIVFGVLINNIIGKPKWAQAGIQFSAKKVLQWSIIALGCGLSLTQVWKTGSESFLLMIISLLAAFACAYGVGKLLGVPMQMRTLIGAGTGICGGSAIAAVSPITEADEADIAYSISTIFMFNIVAVMIFPTLGHLLHMDDAAYGLLAGTAINDTSSVVAAGYIYSDAAGAYATIVKLTRTTMIVPICIILAVITGIKKKKQAAADPATTFSLIKIFPWFIVWFLVASLLNTIGVFSENVLYSLDAIAKFMIVMALTAIGFSADFRKMIKAGVRPIILGLLVWITVTAVSIVILKLTGRF